MTARIHFQVREDTASQSTSPDEIRRFFSEDLDGLYQLSLLLTGNLERATQCLVAGIDCAAEHSTFGEWALSSAKRTIVEMAIRELKPRSHHTHSSSSMTAFHYTGRLSSGPDRHFELETILALEHFERFVFVMSVLERYSEPDCSLLLECSVSEIREARTSAFEKLIDLLDMVFPHNRVCAQETK